MKINILSLTLCLFTGFAAFSQPSTLRGIRVDHHQIEERDGQITISLGIVLDSIHLGSNEMIYIYPVLNSKNGIKTLYLDPVVVAGSQRSKMLKRSKFLKGNSGFIQEPKEMVLRKNGSSQKILYQTTFALSDWMRNADLSLQVSLSGCAECDIENNNLMLAHSVLKGIFYPKLTYLIPEVEPYRKQEKYSDAVNFVVDKSQLLRDFKNNEYPLSKADKIVEEIRSRKGTIITQLSITGHASPEATVEHNLLLAQRRAEAFANYLEQKHGVSRALMNVTSDGEDWEVLKKMVSESDLADKKAILQVIDHVSDPDDRDAQLMKIKNGSVYRQLVQEFYPSIRRTEYVIAYDQQVPFDLEKAEDTYRNNPEKLTSHEFYLISLAYPSGTSESKKLYRTISKFFPQDALANINVSIDDLQQGNYQAVISRLQNFENDSRSWNSIGAAYAGLQNYEQAKIYFKKAAAIGDPNAIANLEGLEDFLTK
jgi:outer membrane protein OmpA-like peptidoglycan-associated protein